MFSFLIFQNTRVRRPIGTPGGVMMVEPEAMPSYGVPLMMVEIPTGEGGKPPPVFTEKRSSGAS